MKTAALARIRLLSTAVEQLIGPLLVFIITFAHHIYFASDYISSFFAAFSLVSLLLVMAVDKTGILLAIGVQLAFLGLVAVQEPMNMLEQMLFSSSVSLSLIATYLNSQVQTVPQFQAAPHVEEVQHENVLQENVQQENVQQENVQQENVQQENVKQDKHWQELYDARQELTGLYQEKQQLEASLATASANQKLLEHHLEVLAIEKQQFVEDRAACEEDLKKFGNHMQEMALYQETLRQEILRLEEMRAKEHVSTLEPEPMYRQLKMQFDEKSKVLDTTRKELFQAQEEIAILQKTIEENLEPTAEERRLMKELVSQEDSIDALKKAHDEELLGYEGVIQGLLNQLHDKQSATQFKQCAIKDLEQEMRF